MARVARRTFYAVVFGTGCAFLAYSLMLMLQPYAAGLSAQSVMWKFYEWAGWWWWGLAVVLSIIGLFFMFTLAVPRTRWGVATRLSLLAGFICHSLSWGNNAFGPLGSMLVLLGTVMILRQLSAACAVERRRQYNTGRTLSHRMLTMFTGEFR